VTLTLPSNFSIRTFEMASNPPLEYANCKCSRVRPEADTFSAIDLEIFFKQISGWRVLKASLFWLKYTMSRCTQELVKLCFRRTVSLMKLVLKVCNIFTSSKALCALQVTSRRSVARACWLNDLLSGYISLKAGRVSENPTVIWQNSSIWPHDVNALMRCLASKPLALCASSKQGFLGLSQTKNLARPSCKLVALTGLPS